MWHSRSGTVAGKRQLFTVGRLDKQSNLNNTTHPPGQNSPNIFFPKCRIGVECLTRGGTEFTLTAALYYTTGQCWMDLVKLSETERKTHIPGISITWTPLHLVFFSLFWGHVFFAFHNLGTFCRGELLKLVWISVPKIWRSLILLFPQENRTYGISAINLCKLGAEFSILRCRKRFRAGQLHIKKNGVKNM
jgi:hypothetical protein